MANQALYNDKNFGKKMFLTLVHMPDRNHQLGNLEVSLWFMTNWGQMKGERGMTVTKPQDFIHLAKELSALSLCHHQPDQAILSTKISIHPLKRTVLNS